MSGHTYTHTHTHTYTHDNYYNPRCARAHRGLITLPSGITQSIEEYETTAFMSSSSCGVEVHVH